MKKASRRLSWFGNDPHGAPAKDQNKGEQLE